MLYRSTSTFVVFDKHDMSLQYNSLFVGNNQKHKVLNPDWQVYKKMQEKYKKDWLKICLYMVPKCKVTIANWRGIIIYKHNFINFIFRNS